MSEPASEPVGPPPETGNHEIDRALASLNLGDDVAAHPERIAAAQGWTCDWRAETTLPGTGGNREFFVRLRHL